MQHIEPSEHTLHGTWRPGRAAVCSVDQGESFTVRTIDVGWGTEAPIDTVSPRAKIGPLEPGIALCGPIHVRGAAPGDTLEIALDSILPGAYGYTFAGGGCGDDRIARRLGIADAPMTLIRWTLDTVSGQAIDDHGRSVQLRPFLGTLGTCPDVPDGTEPWSPRRTGGNLDCRELIAGTRLFLPVEVPGALVSLGDGHAAQGDGEVGGMAIECPMQSVELRCSVRRDIPATRPWALTPTGLVTCAMSSDIDEAIGDALSDMIDHLQRLLDVERTLALAYASSSIDVRITQLVNGVRGAHCVIGRDALTRLGAPDALDLFS